MENFLSLISSPFAGGLFGLLGSSLTQLMGYFKRKQDLSHELALRDADMRMIQAEGEIAHETALIEKDMNAQSLQGSAYEASLRHDMVGLDVHNSLLLIIAEFVRRIYRPFITTGLLMVFGFIYFDSKTSDLMRSEMVMAIITATIMAITWWFADRSFNKTGR